MVTHDLKPKVLIAQAKHPGHTLCDYRRDTNSETVAPMSHLERFA